MEKKSASQLDREIAEALGTTKKGPTTVHIVGLRDGLHTAGTGYYLRKMRELGATVKLAKTGRVTVRDASGKVTIYTVDAPSESGPGGRAAGPRSESREPAFSSLRGSSPLTTTTREDRGLGGAADLGSSGLRTL